MRRNDPRLRRARLKYHARRHERALRRSAKLLRRVHRRRKIAIDPRGRLIAPRQIRFAEPYGSELIRFIRRVERETQERKRRVVVSFKETEAFSAEATLLLYAELDRLASHSPIPKPITIHDPWRRKPREVLKQLRVHEITGDRCDIVPLRDDVVHWRAVKGNDQSGVPSGEFLREALKNVRKRGRLIAFDEAAVWPGLSEAQNNTIEHAYDFARTQGFGVTGENASRWWMFYQLRDGVFTVAVCDLGCGYSQTVDKTIPEAVTSWLQSLKPSVCADTQAIKIAMEYGRSRTGQSERGKGSRNALSVLDGYGGAQLLIHSNSGLVTYARPHSGGELEIKERTFPFNIGGTIVQWILPIDYESE